MGKIKIEYKHKFYAQLEECILEKKEEFEVTDDFAEIIHNLLKEYMKKKS